MTQVCPVELGQDIRHRNETGRLGVLGTQVEVMGIQMEVMEIQASDGGRMIWSVLVFWKMQLPQSSLGQIKSQQVKMSKSQLLTGPVNFEFGHQNFAGNLVFKDFLLRIKSKQITISSTLTQEHKIQKLRVGKNLPNRVLDCVVLDGKDLP